MKQLTCHLARVCATVALMSTAVLSTSTGEYYRESFSSGSSLAELGFQNVNYWELDASAGVMRTTSPGGWGGMSRCKTADIALDRSSEDITVSWNVRFPTDNTIESWRENNKIWVAVLKTDGTVAYKVGFKPNRVVDCWTSPDISLEDGNYSTLATASSHQPTPAGENAAFVKFAMTLTQDGRVKVAYDSKNGEGLIEYINVAQGDYD